jgi:hypothetical protein
LGKRIPILGTVGDGGALTREKKLIQAALIRAIQDYAMCKRTGFLEQYELKYKFGYLRILEIEGFFEDSEIDEPEPFSFPWMCQALWEDWEGAMKIILEYLERGDFSLFANKRGAKRINNLLLQ